MYGALSADGSRVAIKVLSADRATTDKRKRFKNETAFLRGNRHPNIVTVIDHGLAREGKVEGPFYVMHRYATSLREVMRGGVAPGNVLPIFLQVLDGVEAAHLQGVVHRDLKPENILCDDARKNLAIADFGIASFTEELLATLVETAPAQRLANFEYAAPEQRARGANVGEPADLYALGLMLNEMFTSKVPHGTQYTQIAEIVSEYGFLDDVVSRLLRQQPGERPASILALKRLIEAHRTEVVAHQRLSQVSGEVVNVDEIDEPLALEPPKLVSIDWNQGTLKLVLDRKVSPEWVMALHNMGSFSAILGKEPRAFEVSGNVATVSARENQVQQIVDHFKGWLPDATKHLRETLENEARRRETTRREMLRINRENEEARLRVLGNVKI